MTQIKPNSLKAWLLATRPKTLPAGFIPVIAASALAYHKNGFQLIPSLLCLLFAVFAQIASNFSNDYFDYIKETDNENRLGPARAVASGWIKPKQMLLGTILVIILASLSGLGLIFYGGFTLILVGIACFISLLAYTGGPFPLAYHGLGDLFVFIFFGLVAVVFTFFVQTNSYDINAFLLGSIIGFASINILVVNNFRDRETDKSSNKKTSIVLFGEQFGKIFYLTNGFLAVALSFCFFKENIWAATLPLLYIPFHIQTWRQICKINKGKELNVILGKTARNLFLLGILLSIGFIL